MMDGIHALNVVVQAVARVAACIYISLMFFRERGDLSPNRIRTALFLLMLSV